MLALRFSRIALRRISKRLCDSDFVTLRWFNNFQGRLLLLAIYHNIYNIIINTINIVYDSIGCNPMKGA